MFFLPLFFLFFHLTISFQHDFDYEISFYRKIFQTSLDKPKRGFRFGFENKSMLKTCNESSIFKGKNKTPTIKSDSCIIPMNTSKQV
jgi:hypothetical protein